MSAVLAAPPLPGHPLGHPDRSERTAPPCMADDGYCDDTAVAYVFTTPSRTTVVTGPGIAEMFDREPGNARCADHAIAAVEAALVQAQTA